MHPLKQEQIKILDQAGCEDLRKKINELVAHANAMDRHATRSMEAIKDLGDDVFDLANDLEMHKDDDWCDNYEEHNKKENHIGLKEVLDDLKEHDEKLGLQEILDEKILCTKLFSIEEVRKLLKEHDEKIREEAYEFEKARRKKEKIGAAESGYQAGLIDGKKINWDKLFAKYAGKFNVYKKEEDIFNWFKKEISKS